MKLSQELILDFGGAAKVEVDLSKIHMSEEQAGIVGKLISKLHAAKVSITPSLRADQCDNGKCLASQYLAADEFEKIRGLKAELKPSDSIEAVVCDLCLHCWKL